MMSNNLSSKRFQLFFQHFQQLFRNSSAKIKTYYDVVPWCSGLTRLPFTQEITGSNPVRGTKKNQFLDF